MNSDSTLQAATLLYAAGLNIFPVQPGSKKPYGKWGMLTTTRLNRSTLPQHFAESNIGVICGRLSQNLFVLDCDSEPTFKSVGEELRKRGISAWIRNSTRGGQYWLLCAEGEVKNAKLEAGTLDVLGNRKYTLAPPSVHPSGMSYEWIEKDGTLPPVVSITQLDFLNLQLQNGRRHRQTQEKKHALPIVANRVLIEQDATGYHSHSEAEFAAVLSLIGAGRSDEEIYAIFHYFAPPHYLKVGKANFGKHVLAKAHAWRKEQTGDEETRTRHAPDYTAWANTASWPGRTGNTDKAVFLALCQRQHMEPNSPFRASLRELAELADVNKETVHTSLQRLRDRGLIKCTGHDKVCASNLYSLHLPEPEETEGVCIIRTLIPTGGEVPSSVRVMHHDAWSRNALGKSALFCYTALFQQPMTQAELVMATGKSRWTVQRTLRMLSAEGLVTCTDGVWAAVEVSTETLDRIAFRHGTQGHGERRAQQHTEERQQRASTLIARQQQRRRTH